MLKINEMAPFCNLFTTKHLLNESSTLVLKVTLKILNTYLLREVSQDSREHSEEITQLLPVSDMHSTSSPQHV